MGPRLIAAGLAAVGALGLLQAFAGDAVDSRLEVALALSALYGLHLFARCALAGRLPAGARVARRTARQARVAGPGLS